MSAHFAESTDSTAVDASLSGSDSRILDALRLGFLVVESYRILRPRVDYKPKSAKPEDADERQRKRFEYTTPGRLNRSEEIVLANEQLVYLSREMQLSPPPIPDVQELAKIVQNGVTGKRYTQLHRNLDDWSRDVWIRLSTENETAGRAFVYGGSLAYTYWLGYGEREQTFARDVVNPFRLQRIAENLGTLEQHLPGYVFDCLEYSLKRWSSFAEGKDSVVRSDWSDALGKQSEVWRDLIFGRRDPESFLTIRERRRITYVSVAVSATTVFVLMLSFWLIVWIVPRLGMNTLGNVGMGASSSVARSFFEGTSQALSDAKLTDWFKFGSALLATLSSVTLFFAGLVRHVSGWVLDFHGFTREFLTRHYVRRNTLRLP